MPQIESAFEYLHPNTMVPVDAKPGRQYSQHPDHELGSADRKTMNTVDGNLQALDHRIPIREAETFRMLRFGSILSLNRGPMSLDSALAVPCNPILYSPS